MANTLEPGPNTIYTTTVGSTAGTGSWYRVPPWLTRLSVQFILNTSSAGATAGTTTHLEVSNDGVNALLTKGRTFDTQGTTDLIVNGGSLQSSMDAAWGWVRAKVASLTTSTAGSTGSPSVSVIVNAGYSH